MPTSRTNILLSGHRCTRSISVAGLARKNVDLRMFIVISSILAKGAFQMSSTTRRAIIVQVLPVLRLSLGPMSLKSQRPLLMTKPGLPLKEAKRCHDLIDDKRGNRNSVQAIQNETNEAKRSSDKVEDGLAKKKSKGPRLERQRGTGQLGVETVQGT